MSSLKHLASKLNQEEMAGLHQKLEGESMLCLQEGLQRPLRLCSVQSTMGSQLSAPGGKRLHEAFEGPLLAAWTVPGSLGEDEKERGRGDGLKSRKVGQAS